jgi:hypothetical protein
MSIVVGTGSHQITFTHSIGDLQVFTGINEIEWGYNLNVARFPTYGGEVVQVLSCFIDDLTVGGHLQTYEAMEKLYGYFVEYISQASQGKAGVNGRFNQEPIVMSYDHRNWKFHIIPTALPGFRYGSAVVVPEWRLQAHVLDQDAPEDLTDAIVTEAQIKEHVESTDPNFDQAFGLEGKIRFVDENPFSDPWTDAGTSFNVERKKRFDELADWYTSLLPSYMKGDFDAITGGAGSVPAFNPAGSAIGQTGDEAADQLTDALPNPPKP